MYLQQRVVQYSKIPFSCAHDGGIYLNYANYTLVHLV